MLRCIECGAYMTGVEDKNNDGFARCPVHTRRLQLYYGADWSIPRGRDLRRCVGITSKQWIEHRERMIDGLLGRVVHELWRQSTADVGLGGAYYSSWWWDRARQAVTDVPRLPADSCACKGSRLGVEHRADSCGKPTVKRLDIFGQVHDTYQTESELNGWRPSQGRLL